MYDFNWVCGVKVKTGYSSTNIKMQTIFTFNELAPCESGRGSRSTRAPFKTRTNSTLLLKQKGNSSYSKETEPCAILM